MILRWPKRPRRENGPACPWRVWISRCGRYRIVESQLSKLSAELADRVYATVLRGGCWHVLSRHRKPGPARRSCERDAREADA